MPLLPRMYRSLKARIVALVIFVFVSIYLIAFNFARDFIGTSNYELAKQLIGQQVKLTRSRTLSFFDRDQKLIETGIEKQVYQAWMREPTNPTYIDNAIDNLQITCGLVGCQGWFLYAHDSKAGFTYNQLDPEPATIQLYDYDMVWYEPLIASGKTIYIDSSYSERNKFQGVFLDYVVREQGEVLGVVGTYVKLDDILSILLSQEEQGIVNLLIDDKKSLRLKRQSSVNSDMSDLCAQYADQTWDALFPESLRQNLSRLQAEQNKQLITTTLTIDGLEFLATFAYIEQVEWFSVSLYPLNSQYSHFNAFPIFIVSLVILSLFVILSISVLNRLVIKPVMALNVAVDEIHDGNYQVQIGDLGTDRIQNLGDRINEMAGQIRGQIQQLEDSNLAFKQASNAALNANKAKSLFLSNMSHEIRTPLNAILGTLQLLERDQLSANQTNLVTRSLYSARTLMTIINDILDYSKIEANELVLEKTEFELLQVIDSVELDLAANALLKGINLQCEVDKRFSDGWLGDPVRVRQIILNLVSNAVKFTERGGVTIRLSQVTVDKGDGVYVEVIDTGIGMSADEQAQITKRFTQADASTTRKFGGTGLGMAITTNLVELMGGSMCIESEKGKGTIVRVQLPLEKTEITVADDPKNNVGIPHLQEACILIAEDNEINQEILKAMLEPTHVSLDVVANGALAIEAVKNKHYDMVLMDIQMPVMDGIEAFKGIRVFNQTIPVVALTANVMTDDVKHYCALGFNAHIGKPIDMNLLYGLLDQFVSQGRKRA